MSILLMVAACATTPTPLPEPAVPEPAVVLPPPAPEPPPPPPPLVSPDGVTILPCPDEAPPGMVCVPGGPFLRGTDAEHACNQHENIREHTGYGPAATVWAQTFFIDATEVTTEAYQACATAKKCTGAHAAYNDFSRPQQPQMGANWYQARDYCKVNGKHLPTEAQYEKAVRGPDGDDTPFGPGEVSCDTAVVMNAEGVRSCGVNKKPPEAEKGRTFEVAQKPAGRYGAYDLVGNAEEWVYDWFSKDYTACGADCLGTDPKGPCGGADDCPGHTLKMVKGGSWYWEPMHATGWHRRPHVPNNHPYHHFGFRCAASLDEAAGLVEAAKPAPEPEPTPAPSPPPEATPTP